MSEDQVPTVAPGAPAAVAEPLDADRTAALLAALSDLEARGFQLVRRSSFAAMVDQWAATTEGLDPSPAVLTMMGRQDPGSQEHYCDSVWCFDPATVGAADYPGVLARLDRMSGGALSATQVKASADGADMRVTGFFDGEESVAVLRTVGGLDLRLLDWLNTGLSRNGLRKSFHVLPTLAAADLPLTVLFTDSTTYYMLLGRLGLPRHDLLVMPYAATHGAATHGAAAAHSAVGPQAVPGAPVQPSALDAPASPKKKRWWLRPRVIVLAVELLLLLGMLVYLKVAVFDDLGLSGVLDVPTPTNLP